MDKDYKIVLNSAVNINSVNVDTHVKLELLQIQRNLCESEFNTFVSAADVFNNERETNNIYRIYGTIEYLTLLDGIKLDLSSSPISDYFIQAPNNPKTIFNSFDFYLLKPKGLDFYSGYTNNLYVRQFDIIAYPTDFNVFNAGFSVNVFNDQKYIFIINKDIDINGSNGYERNNVPITELYIYAQYKPSIDESISGVTWTIDSGNTVTTTITSGIIMTDCCLLDMINYNQTIIQTQTNYISTPYISGATMYYINWKYNPFIPITTRLLSDELFGVYSGNTSYDLISSIPEYAYDGGGGNYAWRNIQTQDYINPITFETLNYPFINGRRYCFNNFILNINTNNNDLNTNTLFSSLFYTSELINYKPSSDLNNIDQPCI
jgi:hypothetical protein